MSKKYVILFGWIPLVVLWCAGCNERTDTAAAKGTATSAPVPAAEGAPASVAVHRATLRRSAPAVGNFRARRLTKLCPQISGRVQEVLVNVGDVVREGQELVRLDPTFFEIQVLQQQAAMESARATLAGAEANLTYWLREIARQKDLLDRGAGSTKELDDGRTAGDRAQAARDEQRSKLVEAEMKLQYARQNLKETRILAPFDGAITARYVDPGESAVLMPPTQLVEIQEIGVLYLEFALPQELLDLVRVDATLEFEVEGVQGGTGSATVAVIFPSVDPMTRSFRCRAVIDNPARKYQPGLLAKVNVVLQEAPNVLVVPRAALTPTASGFQISVLVDGRPTLQAVDVGLQTDDLAEIRSGLKEGDRIVATKTAAEP